MRSPLFPPLGSHPAVKLAGRLSFVALLVGVSACSNFGRSPVFTGSTNQRDIILGQEQAQGYGTTPLGNTYVGAAPGGVQGADLPPPGASAYAPQEIQQQPYSSGPRPQPYTPPQASAQPAASHMQRGAPPTTLNQEAAALQHRTGQSAGGSGPAMHVVQPGDTAWNISQRYGITVDQLAAANGGSTTVRLGSRIVIPGASGRPVQVASLDPRAGVQQPAPQAAPRVPEAAVQPQHSSPLAQAQQQISRWRWPRRPAMPALWPPPPRSPPRPRGPASAGR